MNALEITKFMEAGEAMYNRYANAVRQQEQATETVQAHLGLHPEVIFNLERAKARKSSYDMSLELMADLLVGLLENRPHPRTGYSAEENPLLLQDQVLNWIANYNFLNFHKYVIAAVDDRFNERVRQRSKR